ncbi:MAG TPA: imidazoleglycerol-phosphate dehydratase HisB [Chloroflexota bacterium]|nr:imidazoleglycerol-phosphate dehydratase HisB [Chloroflexota bacterium]
MRRASLRSRKTNETDVRVRLDLDSADVPDVDTGIGFFDHMLTLFAQHGGFTLNVRAKGDLTVDPHHSVEDVGIVLGEALREALGDKAGIRRYACAYVPMDEALVRTALDLSGRSFCHYHATVRARRLGSLDTELVEDFLRALADHGKLTMHVDMIRGRNSHHIVEAVFKSLGRALGEAVEIVGTRIPSTKGTLSG